MENESAMPAEIKLSCRGVWKLYGAGADAFLAKNPDADADAARAAGFIPAVCDVGLKVRAGETFVIMGLSGSGKSTLVRCLSRLVHPDAGRILFNGRDLLRLSEKEMVQIRRRQMGMVFQHFALLPDRTVLGNVAFPLEVQGIAPAAREARAREMINLVGLSGRENYYPRELSGGQQQRVGIARSLAVAPELWFLDEPFSALDPLIRRDMQNEFLRLQKTLRKTIVFITHDFDEAIRLADSIAIMKEGGIVQIGSPEDLVVRPANGYVAAFTRDVPRIKVLSVAAAMSSATKESEDYAGSLRGEQKLQDAAAMLYAAARPFAVVGGDGRRIGKISREDLFRSLLPAGAEKSSPPAPDCDG
jgi:glycine betaine/proline transport system ATP-binding protein